MWGYARPERGDWVRATRTIPITLTDHVAGSGVRAGTLGVVLDRSSGHLRVRFDNGWGSCTARVRDRDCRLQSRRRGEAAFARRVEVLTVVRLALAAFLVWPLVWFAAQYVWRNHGTNGLLTALATGVVEGALDYATMAISHPVQFLVYAAFLAVVGKIAFPR